MSGRGRGEGGGRGEGFTDGCLQFICASFVVLGVLSPFKGLPSAAPVDLRVVRAFTLFAATRAVGCSAKRKNSKAVHRSGLPILFTRYILFRPSALADIPTVRPRVGTRDARQPSEEAVSPPSPLFSGLAGGLSIY